MMISPNVILDIINKLIICKSSIKKIMKSKVLSYLDIYSSIPKVYINQQSRSTTYPGLFLVINKYLFIL